MNETKPINQLQELSNTQELCQALLKTPHYAKMGMEGIFAIVQTAKSLNIDPMQALSGGLYYVKGRVEMSARMMNAIIRSHKHSVTMDGQSCDSMCILHGKRSDTGDMMKASFTINEAKAAGLVRAGGPWMTCPSDMLFARALSRLARRLFPDCVQNCYVEGEIALDPNIRDNSLVNEPKQIENTPTSEPLTQDEVRLLDKDLEEMPDYREKIDSLLQSQNLKVYSDLPRKSYEVIMRNIEIRKQKAKVEVNNAN